MISKVMTIFFFTQFIGSITFYVAIIAISATLFYAHRKREAVLVFISATLMQLLVHLLKITFKVPRPDTALVELNSYAFPSGHAAGAAFMVTTIYLYLLVHLRPKLRFGLTALFLLIAVIIAWSRVALHVHTLDQIAVGFGIGILWPILFYICTQKLFAGDK
jgi:membrane-associated phospholipid phosphatase